jgi:hypothetical protein
MMDEESVHAPSLMADMEQIRLIAERHNGKYSGLFLSLLRVYVNARLKGKTPERAAKTVNRVYLASIGAGGPHG